MDTSTTPTPSSSLLPCPVKGDYSAWKHYQNINSVWAGFQCCPGRGAHPRLEEVCRFLISGWIWRWLDSHPSGFSSLWIHSLLLSQSVNDEKVWACPKGRGTSMGPVHIPRVCPSPIPRLIPCFSRHIQRFTPDPIRFYWEAVFPDSLTSSISVLAHRVTHKILSSLWLSNKSPNKTGITGHAFCCSQGITLLNKPSGFFLFCFICGPFVGSWAAQCSIEWQGLECLQILMSQFEKGNLSETSASAMYVTIPSGFLLQLHFGWTSAPAAIWTSAMQWE